MGVTRTGSAAAIAAALVLTACQGDGSDDSSETPSSPGAAPTGSAARTADTSTTTAPSSSTSKPPKKTIKSVDLHNTTWTFRPEGKATEVQFKDGKAQETSETGEPMTYQLRKPLQGKQPTYVDTDGDGDLDAFVEVFSAQGNGWSIDGYVWLWDAKQQKAVQQHQPIFRDGRCGDVTDKVTFDGKGKATISYLKREDEACAEQPTTSETRTLDTTPVSGPFQTKPWASSLDHCNPVGASDDVFFPQDIDPEIDGFRSAPHDDAPVIVRRDDIKMWNATDRTRSPEPGEWVKVWYIPAGSELDSTDRLPCGWFKR